VVESALRISCDRGFVGVDVLPAGRFNGQLVLGVGLEPSAADADAVLCELVDGDAVSRHSDFAGLRADVLCSTLLELNGRLGGLSIGRRGRGGGLGSSDDR